MSARSAPTVALVFLSLVLSINAANADAPSPPAQPDGYANFLAHDAKIGPVSIPLRDQAVLKVPAGFAFLPEARARTFMKNVGNDTDAGFMGLILPVKQEGWFSFLDYNASGYIRDDDAKTWDANKMIADIRKNTEENNKERVKQGIPALEVLGWVEKPHYDAKTHCVIWSISARDVNGKSAVAGDIINYRTLALGREGYIAVVMVTDLSQIGVQKSYAKELLDNLSFNSGKRYTDFDASTDHVAEYGLATLIGGVVAHKLGFFALAAAFGLKFMKVIGLAIFAGLAGLRRFFGFGKKQPVQPLLNTPPPAPTTSDT